MAGQSAFPAAGRPSQPGLGVGQHPGWPAELGPVHVAAGAVALRPLRRGDGEAWRQIRVRDEKFIARWDATSSLTWEERHRPGVWRSHRTALARAARRGEVMPFAITVNGRFAGQVTIGGIQRGALGAGWVGYWVDSTVHRRGVATSAVALAIGHGLGAAGLHRIEATIAPDNAASLAVVGHLGFRQEGYLQRYLDVGGGWRDHVLFAMTSEEVRGGVAALLDRYRQTGHSVD